MKKTFFVIFAILIASLLIKNSHSQEQSSGKKSQPKAVLQKSLEKLLKQKQGYVIFTSQSNDSIFIQFTFSYDGNLLLDIPLYSQNENLKEQTETFLNNRGFSYRVSRNNYDLKPFEYGLNQLKDGGVVVNAIFPKDSELVAKSADEIFKEIFGLSEGYPLNVEFGE